MKKQILVVSAAMAIVLLAIIFYGISAAHEDKQLRKTVTKEVFKKIPSNTEDNNGIHLLEPPLNQGSSSQRPKGVSKGFVYFDTTLNRPIFWNGKTWIEKSWINLKDFGAKGDGVTDDTEVIQVALNIARDYGQVRVYLPEGVYNTRTLRLYQNTFVSLNKKAVIRRVGSGYKLFVNGKIGDRNYASGYNGEGNIHFTNGTIDLNTIDAPIPSDKSTTAFDLAHADNLSFRNLKVKNGQNGHYFQLSSSKNVRFEGCWFGDVNYTNPSSKNYELIQIEESTRISFPTFGGYDGTVSKDILIKDCHFENVIRAIGTHSYPRASDGVTPLRYNENIRVIHNVFKNSISQFAHFAGFKNVTIENNVFENYGEEPIYLTKTYNSTVNNNRFIGSTNAQ